MVEVEKEEVDEEGEATQMGEEIRLEFLGTGSNGSRHRRSLNCKLDFHDDIRKKLHIDILASGVYSPS
jgi:hypothetical protein